MSCKINLEGQIFGKLTVLNQNKRVKNGKKFDLYWLCHCECGKEVWRATAYLRRYKPKLEFSCGCSKIKHGHSKEKLFTVWLSMKSRCHSLQPRNVKSYLEKGIEVCEEWQDYEKFKLWSLNNGYLQGLEIDRIDNGKGYSPENCRWVTRAVNVDNRDVSKHYEAFGEVGTIRYFSTKYNINYKTIKARLEEGMSMEETVSKPVRYAPKKGYNIQREYQGVKGNLKEICEHFNKNYHTIKSRIYICHKSLDEAMND
jgi:hypothetical protein